MLDNKDMFWSMVGAVGVFLLPFFMLFLSEMVV